MICLKVEQLTKTFGDVNVVDDVSFELQEHTATALIGPNGAGKTTTLSMLTNLLKPTSGNIIMPGVKDIRKEIGFLPQYPQFFSWMTAYQYVKMAAELNDVPKTELKGRIERMLAFVGLEEAMHKKIGNFSGGMKQRLGIAQAIIHEPKLILLDEPVSALDPVGRREMMDLLKRLQKTTTILYSTHILNDAEQMTDQVLFLKKGKLVEQGHLKEVQDRYAEPKIVVEFENKQQAKHFAAKFNHTTINETKISIHQQDHQPTMQHLVSIIANEQYTIRKIAQETSTLEEIFLKVANGK